jgi:hypothetical protein
MQYRNHEKITLTIPAGLSFIIALILLYKYTFPISWDVYYHIHMADLYMRNGLVFWDFETVAPYGRVIMYPPLFHLVLAGLSKVTGIGLVSLVRLLQPVFSFFLIFSITWSSYKLFDFKTGMCTGVLGMLSFITFNRSVICTPATIAIGLSLLCCVYFFNGFKDNNIRSIIFSAILLGIIFNLHMATSIITVFVLGLYGLVQLLRRNLNINYLVIFILFVASVGLPWWIYVYLKYTLVFNSKAGNLLSLPNFFFKYYGIIPSVLTIMGYVYLIKNRSDKSLFLILWTVSLMLISQTTYLGVQTVSIRILEVASYPMILVAGLGFTYLCDNIKSTTNKRVLFILLILVSCLSSMVYVDSYTPEVMCDDDYDGLLIPETIHTIIDPVGTILKPSVISLRFGNSQLAHDRYDVMEWFMAHSNKSLVVSEDSIMDSIIVSTSRSPVVYGGFTESIPLYVVDPVHIVQNHSTSSELSDLNVGYILLRQNTPIPIYAQLEYNNTNYKICSIKSTYKN